MKTDPNRICNGGCHHPDTEALTPTGWKKLGAITGMDKVAVLFNDQTQKLVEGSGRRQLAPQILRGRFVLPHDIHSFEYNGILHGLETKYAGYLVTPNHRVWRSGASKTSSHWSTTDAKVLDGGVCSFMIKTDFDLSERADPLSFSVAPAISKNGGNVLPGPTEFPFSAWVKFMAVYLAEGNIRHTRESTGEIVLTKKEGPIRVLIEDTLKEMGMMWVRRNIQYITQSNMALRNYLAQFGKAPDKFIPNEIKLATKESIRLFLDTIWQCDGDRDGGKQYYTTSARLAEEIQHLLHLMGEATSITMRPPRWHQNYDGYTVHIMDYDTVGTKKMYKSAYFTQPYTGKVNCLQVPGEGIILTRYKGKIMWNGN